MGQYELVVVDLVDEAGDVGNVKASLAGDQRYVCHGVDEGAEPKKVVVVVYSD